MSMRHHWAELDALLAELDEAERFKRARPRLAAVALRNEAAENKAQELAAAAATAGAAAAAPSAVASKNLRITN